MGNKKRTRRRQEAGRKGRAREGRTDGGRAWEVSDSGGVEAYRRSAEDRSVTPHIESQCGLQLDMDWHYALPPIPICFDLIQGHHCRTKALGSPCE